MNKYKIQQKIITAAKIVDEFLEYEGFIFEPFNKQERWKSDGLLVTKEIIADDGKQALVKYDETLIPIVDVLAVISQCSMSIVLTSMMLYRLESPADCTFVASRRPRKTVGMPLQKKSMDDVKKLESLDNEAALLYLREANNASTILGRLSMLLSATEALAGSEQKKNECPKCNKTLICPKCGQESPSHPSTNKIKLKEICGQELSEKLYERDEEGRWAIRHKLAHGRKAERDEVYAVVNELHVKLIEHVKRVCNLSSIDAILKYPRTLNASKEEGRYYVHVKNNHYNLPEIEKHLWPLLDNGREESDKLKLILDNPPTSY